MPTACNFHLSFDAIVVPWLKQAAKEYCRYATPLFSVGHLQSILLPVKLFSEFAHGQRPDFGPADINRPLLLDFYRFITRKKLSPVTLANLYLDLRTFLRACAREGWGDIPDRHVIYNEDIPKTPKPQPRFIPPEVMDQFMQRLDELPLLVRRLLYILIEVGLRSAELFLLPLDCLLQDSQGAWFLRYYQFKERSEGHSRQGSCNDHSGVCSGRVGPYPPTRCASVCLRVGGLRCDGVEWWKASNAEARTDLL